MKTESQRPEGREGAIERLNTAIEATTLAEKASPIAPAKIVFGSVGILLAQIRVCFLLLCHDPLQAHTWPGLHGKRAGLRRAWVILCRYLQSA